MKQAFWKTDWFPGLIVSVLCMVFAGAGLISQLEWKAYDLGAQFSKASVADDSVVIIAIDEASIDELGQWPWPRDRLSRVVRQLSSARASVIGLTVPLDTGQNRHTLEYLKELRETNKKDRNTSKVLRKMQAGLDTDLSLALSLKNAVNTVLPLGYEPGQVSAEAAELSLRMKKHAISQVTETSLKWQDYLPGILNAPPPDIKDLKSPVQPITPYASGIGVLDFEHSTTAFGRATPLVHKYGEHYFPSYTLLFAAYAMGLSVADIKLDTRQGITLGNKKIESDPSLRFYPRHYESRNGVNAFKVYSFKDVYNKSIKSREFRNKTVLIGFTAPHLNDAPISDEHGNASPLETLAHSVYSLLNGDAYKTPAWARLAQLVGMLVVAVYLMFILPRLRVTTGITASALLLFILFNIEFVSMLAKGIWIPLMLPVFTLLTGILLIVFRRGVVGHFHGLKVELSDSSLMLGQYFQSQGQLDQAFEKYSRCITNDELLDKLYNLGLDYERKRQLNKAVTVFQDIQSHNVNFRDVEERVKRNKELANVMVLGGKSGKGEPSGTMILTTQGLQKPMLGRYVIEDEIGRGAMGLVYLGKDPKIGRQVAIKTMALSQEFEGEQLDEVKSRFLREAETAGRLNHPNIVTIYDVGEEQDLAYIAMDYLKGTDLSSACKEGHLLVTDDVFDIAIKVAEALDYAHEHKVIHRDI
ncbi:CHASE2 domain-containing protein, partial [Candidatus Pacearchaeota archaeon]|nr:CHASE2 domain-containing protein [Candidatus Pacearchaeota archaeon]